MLVYPFLEPFSKLLFHSTDTCLPNEERLISLTSLPICRSNPVVWQEARPEVEASDGKSKKKK